ncbi:unnamed protein product [Cladocopium goreaui]|uniref:EH domain-containing protein n=1 Tax=Cladocopium goreaui TaxID=2562237 RepID=A0A9P1D3Q9_9DINO|nr:unnamed protein product [Cladocopium goreaui]
MDSHRLQLADSAADARRLFSNLDFTRQQIEDFERLVARLREARSVYSKVELEMAKASREGNADLETQESDRVRAADLSEKVRRASRRKQDLQGKQQLLLAQHRQAEQDRNYARKALDDACKKLLDIQAHRLQVCQERHKAAQEALKLAKDCGLGPSVLKELCRFSAESSLRKSDRKDLKRSQSGVPLGQPSWQPSPGEGPAENGWALFGAGRDAAAEIVVSAVKG